MPLKKGEALPDDAIMYVIMPIPRAATKLKMKCTILCAVRKESLLWTLVIILMTAVLKHL
jgi:hypothetical protein